MNKTFPPMDHLDAEKIIDVDKIYTEEQQRAIGKEIAKIFLMKKSKDTPKNMPDRYLMTWGDKTDIGLFRTLVRIAEDIMNQKEIKS